LTVRARYEEGGGDELELSGEVEVMKAGCRSQLAALK